MDFDSKYLYTGLYNPQWPLISEEFTFEMNVEVERVRLEILLSEPPLPPQYDISPRRSPAVSTGLDRPGVPQTELQQTEQKETFYFQAGGDDFLHVDCMKISEQEGTISFRVDVGVNPEMTSVQLAALQEFVKLPIGRQRRGTASIEQNKQFDPGGQ